jgi:hypothetical protein
MSRSRRPVEVGKHEDVEQLGAGSRPERIKALLARIIGRQGRP